MNSNSCRTCLFVAVLSCVPAWLAAEAAASSAPGEDVVDLSKGRPWLPPLAPLTEAQQHVLTAFSRAFHVQEVVPDGKGVAADELKTLRKKVREEYGLRRDGAVLRGHPFGFFRGSEKTGKGAAVSLPELVATINQVVAAYGRASREQESELREMFLDLCRHILNEELIEGAVPSQFPGALFPIASANYGWLHQSRGIISMRSVLADAGLLLPMMRAVSWWANPDWMDEVIKPQDSDFWRCGHWLDLERSIAAMPDSPEKWQRVTVMMRFFSSSIVGGDALPPSGEFSHHGGFHLAYSYAAGFVVGHTLRLHQAGLEVTPEARERLRAYGRTTAWLLMDERFAVNLALRPTSLGSKSIAGELRTLADLGESGTAEPIDREMASLYLACTRADPAKDEAAARYRAAGIAPTVLHGALALPVRPGLVWRTPETLVSVAAMRPDLRGFEAYSWSQTRYVLNGSVMVLKSGSEPLIPGFELDKGWNWSLWPAATSLLENDVALTPRALLRYGGNSIPVGGVCTLGATASVNAQLQQGPDAAGLFMVDFNGNDDAATFRKSVFAVGGHVLVQTSGIDSKRKPAQAAPCVTALYQDHLATPEQASVLNGRPLAGARVAEEVAMDRPHSLTDAVGMNYVALPVPGAPRKPVLRVLRRHQSWRTLDARFIQRGFEPKTDLDRILANVAAGKSRWPNALPKEVSTAEFLNHFIPQEGDFALAYFDHGAAPENAADAFVLTPEPAKAAGSALPVILEQTKSGHAAFDETTGTYAYAAFEPEVDWTTGPLARTGRPVAVLIRNMPDRTLKLAVASWDLKNADDFTLTLNGVWKLAALVEGISATARNGATELKSRYSGDMPQTVELQPKAR